MSTDESEVGIELSLLYIIFYHFTILVFPFIFYFKYLYNLLTGGLDRIEYDCINLGFVY